MAFFFFAISFVTSLAFNIRAKNGRNPTTDALACVSIVTFAMGVATLVKQLL